MTLEDIAVRLGRSTVTIYSDCKYLEKQWAKEAEGQSYAHHVAVQRKKLALLQQEAWAGWYRSLNRKGKLKEIRKRAAAATSGGSAGADALTVLIKSGAGDPRFLAVIQRAIEEENILLKIRQPELNASDSDSNNIPPLSIEVARDTLDGSAIFVTDSVTAETDEVIDGIAVAASDGSSEDHDNPGEDGDTLEASPEAAG